MEDWRERGGLQPASMDRPRVTSLLTAMKGNSRSVRQKAAAAIAMLLVLVGVAIAAVSATGADRPNGAERARHSAAGIRYRDLPAAASYLGLSPTQLEAELRSGRSLAQIAASTPGRSPAGLIDALIAAKRQRIAARAAAGRLTSSQAERANGRAEKLVEKAVNRRLHPRHQRG